VSHTRSLTPSAEQSAIIERSVAGDSLRILAFAGTGKTTTLEFIAEALPGKRITYLVFNRSQATIAQQRFAGHPLVKPTTMHGLAYGAVGHQYKERLQANEFLAYRAWYDFMIARGALGDFPEEEYGHAFRTIATTLRRFIASADRTITAEHVPLTDFDKENIALLTRRLWSSLAANDSLPISHDWYLKRYQMLGASITADVILCDEAQDLTPSQTSLIASQTHAQQIFCGDPHQQLYEFRGAVNTLATIDLPAFPLTETRRFGPQIATVANAILKAKGETLRIRGIGPDSGLVKMGYPSRGDAVLARTNAGLVERALVLIDGGARIFIRGGTDSKTGRAGSGSSELMGSLMAAFNLKNGRRDSHPTFASFRNWDELERAAQSDGGEALRPYIRLVDKHAKDVPRIVARIRDSTLDNETHADVVLSTVHRIKGEEYPVVALGNDFREFVDEHGHLDQNEANVVYVAVSRSASVLHYGGAYNAINASLERCDIETPVSPHAAIARTSPEPPPAERRTYRELVPGTQWTHPQHGLVTIVDATANLIRIKMASGETIALGTLAAYPRLTPA